MHIEPRNGASIDRIYLHTNEGPQEPAAATSLRAYMLDNGPDGGGYHAVADNDGVVRCANDDQVVWGEGGDNEHCLSLCFIGYAAATLADWQQPYSVAEIEFGAHQVAAWCKAYNVPAVAVAPGAPGQAPTERGIAEHAFDHNPLSEGHTDPGVGFPLAYFIGRVQQLIAPINWAAIEQLVEWKQRVTEHPLVAGYQAADVTALKEMLNRIGEGPGNDTVLYGPKLVACVKAFKVKHNVGNDDGSAFGGTAADALFKLL